MEDNNSPEKEIVETEEAPEPEEPAHPAPVEPAAPAPKARGRPKGSKNKPKVLAVSVANDDPPEPIPPPEPPKLKRQARPKAEPRVQETPPTPQEVAAYMLAALRQQQQDRADRRRDKYTAWFS